jgi:hypothetical protein
MKLRVIVSSPWTTRRVTRAQQRWRSAAQTVSARWETFVRADDWTRAFAFSSYVTALDAEEAAAADIARLTPAITPWAGRSVCFIPTQRSMDMPRFLSWLAIALAGTFLVVARFAFSASTLVNLTFAVSIATLVVSLGIGYAYRTHAWTTIVAACTALVSAWNIVASLVFSNSTMQDLALAGSIVIAGLAVVGLTVHELSVERVVHSLDGRNRQGSPLPAAA